MDHVAVVSGWLVAWLAAWGLWRLVLGIIAEASGPSLEWDLTRASIGRMLRVAGRPSVPADVAPFAARGRRYEPLEAGDVDPRLCEVRR
ncbi:MAG: hypothetical protein IPQ07_40080 [Myxococcales bacterium]|nr:hypothetical protein [Myxococcales bacterium]